MSNTGAVDHYRELLRQLQGVVLDDAVRAARKLASGHHLEAVPELIATLRATEHYRLRNAAAIALADLGSKEGKDEIVSLLKDKITLDHRGSLLYALESYDCSDVIDLMVELACDENFEVSRQALVIMKSIRGPIEATKLDDCLRKIDSALADASGDEKLFLSEAGEILRKQRKAC